MAFGPDTISMTHDARTCKWSPNFRLPLLDSPAMNARVERLLHKLARKRLRNVNFSIISNNCWGAHVYQALRLEFTTPFIGLFLSPQSYLRLLADFPRSLSQPLNFKEVSDEPWVNQLRETSENPWPIGQLGNGIEIQFMHYKSATEAGEKWNRRLARLVTNPERLFVKFCDRDGCSPEQLAQFDALPFRNKIFFTARQDCPNRHAVKIPWQESRVPDGRVLSQISPAYFDSIDWINGMSGRTGRFWKWLSCV